MRNEGHLIFTISSLNAQFLGHDTKLLLILKIKSREEFIMSTESRLERLGLLHLKDNPKELEKALQEKMKEMNLLIEEAKQKHKQK
jgi:hypothetical protein